MHPDQRAVLRQVKDHLRRFGVANDAEDHGAGEEAKDLRREAFAGLTSLLAAHPFVSELLPTLRWEVEKGNVATTSWWGLEDAVDAWLAVTGVRRDRS
jgi:hypothetical protein